jgi:hypothetical protein
MFGIDAASTLCLLLALLTLGYLALCAAKPFRRCRRCKGTGIDQRTGVRRARGRRRTCRLCGGIGLGGVRVGRHIWTAAKTEHHRGTRHDRRRSNR